MNIELELKTQRFDNEKHKLALNLMNVGSAMISLSNKEFMTYGLTNPQYNLLSILNGCFPESMNVGNVQSRMVDKSSNVTRLALKLREKGYVVQFSNAQNRRIQELRITAIGIEALKEAQPAKENVLSVLNELSEAEMVQMNLLLGKITRLNTDVA